MSFRRNVEAGKIRSVGVSNFSARQMQTAYRELAKLGLPLASNQVQISLLHRKIETNGVLETARELGVTLIAYCMSPVASDGRYRFMACPPGLTTGIIFS